MAETARPPRILIDFEHGGFDFHDISASLNFFEFGPSFASWDEVWLFHDGIAPLIRGFYYPVSAPDRYRITLGPGPSCVLIDNRGDQLWLSGISCGNRGEHTDTARRLLTTLNVVVPALVDYDELHFRNGQLVGTRLLADTRPSAPPGKTFVHNGRIACRMEFDSPGTTPDDLRVIWELSTQPHGWLGQPTSLTLYDSRSRSQSAGHEGCHLIATGETGRELWLQLPEADTYDRLAFNPRTGYTGSFTEYEFIKAAIFRSVGVDITVAERSWRDVIFGRHPEPAEIVSWP